MDSPERVRSHWAWAVSAARGARHIVGGPLLCGGITVFNPLVIFGIKPTQRVGVVGIGGLGHMAVKFAAAWGCDVTAFTSSASKADEAKAFGAHRVVSSRDSKAIRGTLDFLLVTVNVPLDWKAMIATLAPKGRMHVVGAVTEPIPVEAFDLIGGQRSISGSPTGAPVGTSGTDAWRICAERALAVRAAVSEPPSVALGTKHRATSGKRARRNHEKGPQT